MSSRRKAAIGGAGIREASFYAGLSCDGVHTEDKEGISPFMKLAVDPAQFEPPAGSLELHSQNMLRLAPGDSEMGFVDANGKKGGEVRFSLKDVPDALTAFLDTWLQLSQPDRFAVANPMISAKPGAAPGRYFVGLAATSAGQTTETEIVVDVVK
jgi:hypothetical protein